MRTHGEGNDYGRANDVVVARPPAHHIIPLARGNGGRDDLVSRRDVGRN